MTKSATLSLHTIDYPFETLAQRSRRNYKDFIASIVEKRNKIVHHNDDALDLSFSDVVATIDNFRGYAECLFKAVCADPHLRL